jgi:hypothetical protein
MKNLIYFDNSKENFLIKVKYEKQLLKISGDKQLDTNQLISKFTDITKIISNIYNINKEYDLIITANYQKILTIILLHLCKTYKISTQTKPHIILSYNESNFIINVCKKLLKSDIIENITILKELDIIDEFKRKKQNNTLFAFVSNINNNLSYDLSKLSTFCKYYNIVLISNLDNLIFNYLFNNDLTIPNNLYFLNNQDIISLHYYEQKNKIFIVLLKKTFINKYKFNEINNLFINSISNESLIYIINIISYYNTYEVMYKKYYYNFNEFITLLNNDYKIINYNTFQYTQYIYFTNSISIVLLTNIKYTNFLINNIYFSIYIPNIKFSNSQLIDYFKINGIITNTNIKFPNISSKNILNGLVGINISYLTKSQDIKKFIKLINNFINLKLHKIINIKKKKHIQFCNPEYIVLSTPFNAKNEGPLKSILKK